MTDHDWMMRALKLAERGRGAVEPNPLVGAVLVRDGQNVGEGWHERYGEAHAEVNAFARAGDRSQGATLYVTLEPCCHFGKTPPCTDAVLRSGVKRVVVAMADPFPQVDGGGLTILRDAGIEVVVGVAEAEARKVNAPYLTLLQRHRPYVHAKWAMTLDGKIATATGHSRWISGEVSREQVHALRGRMDAIIVGGGTVRADDPLLTARPAGSRVPTRIIVTASGNIPTNAQLFRTLDEAPLVIATTARGVERLKLPSGVETIIAGPSALLAELGKRRFTNVLVEGGSSLLGAFRDLGTIDEVHVFIAPKLIGGERSLSPIGGIGVPSIDQGMNFQEWTCMPSGEDWYIQGRRG